MIPVVSGFDNLQLVISSNDWRSTNVAEGYVGHPFGKCIYVKAMPHWATLGELPAMLLGPQSSLGWWGSFIIPVHPAAVTVELKDGYMKFTRNAAVTADMRWKHHCYSIASSPRWAGLERRLQAGDTFVPRREFEALFPQSSSGPRVNNATDLQPTSVKAWRLYAGLGDNLEALISADIPSRAALLETIVRGVATPDYYTWFIVLDDNHWLPLIYEVRALASGTAVQFECSYVGTYTPEFNEVYYP